MPYVRLTNTSVCVNDPSSAYYNQLVDAAKVKVPDWHSSERMILADNRYKWGVFVEHNIPPGPAVGSCIFLHVWKDSQTATAGCTAMPEDDLVKLIRWLDPVRRPLLVQMPRPIYRKLHSRWNLPEVGAAF